MAKKQLVRTLGLAQILMLGIGGTMGAGVFVLTGHAAGTAGRLKGWLLGNVTQQVVEHALCSVWW